MMCAIFRARWQTQWWIRPQDETEAEFLKEIEGWNRLRGIGLEQGLPMLHKMLIFKRGVGFSSSRRRIKSNPVPRWNRVYPCPTLLQPVESMPTWNWFHIWNQLHGIDSKFLNSLKIRPQDESIKKEQKEIGLIGRKGNIKSTYYKLILCMNRRKLKKGSIIVSVNQRLGR